MKSILLSILLLMPFVSFLAQSCEDANRYTTPLFEEHEIIIKEMAFATFEVGDLWAQGDTGNVCFPIDNYLEFTDSNFTMKMDIYMPDSAVDNCRERIAILFTHGGGYAHFSGNKRGTAPVDLAMAAARRGFVVAVVDYRKGWDIARATDFLCQPLLSGCQNCECDGPDCDPFSFTLATYRMAQDIKAGHKKIINQVDSLGIDLNNIHYWGSSTGAVGTMYSAFGGAELEAYTDNNGNSLQTLAGSLDQFGESVPASTSLRPRGVHTIAGAIGDLSWIQADDDIALIMSHGSRDEAVPYCTGRILDMRYNCAKDFKHLTLHGPGKVYRMLQCFDDDKMRGHLYTYNGLYHAFTIAPWVNTPSFNCDQADELEEILAPAFAFCRTVWQNEAINNEHHRFINTATDNVDCRVIREDTSSQCGLINCADLVVVPVKELQAFSSLRLFPNPNTGVLQLQSDHPGFQLSKIELFTATGISVFQKEGQQMTAFMANIQHLPNGLYLARINDQLTLKFVLEK